MSNLNDKTKDELMELARERDIEGRSSMDKDELIAALGSDGGSDEPFQGTEAPADRGDHGFA